MKKVFLLLFCCLTISSSFGQTNKTITSFSKFYKANQPDSIFNLFSSQMKTAIKPEGTVQFISQLKTQLGEIVAINESKAKSADALEFRLSFEKPLVDMAIYISKDSIGGMFQRPREPKKSDSVDTNSSDNYNVDNPIGTVYGTLTLPKDKNKVPIVLMIGGSGPTDRNMNQGQALSTNSFAMLAKDLAENGIASVRYDKGGVGKSSKAINPENINLDDYINDASLFINKLSADNRFSKIIVLGHSEGALIGSVASLRAKPAAYISLCGFDSNMVDLMGQQLKPVLSSQDFAVYTELAESMKAGKVFKRDLPASFGGNFTATNQSFLISMLKYDASTEIAKLKIPVLVIGGSTDIQVPASAAVNLAKMNKKAALKIIPEMNHVLKKAASDRAANVATYNNPALPLHPDLVPILKSFILTIK